MNLDQDFFQVSKLSEDQKKRSSPEAKRFFSPNSGEIKTKKRSSPEIKHLFPRIKAETCAQMHNRVKLLGEGMQM